MNIILLPEDTQHSVTLNNANVLKHAHQVLKLQVGDVVKVGILRGNLGTATVADIQPHRLTLTNIQCHQTIPKKLPLGIVLALPRPKVLRRLIIDMTAMGVENLILINSYRSEKSYWQSPLLKRIDEFITEGLQQAGDTVPLNVTFQHRFKPFVEDELPQLIVNKQAIVAHPYSDRHLNQVWQNHLPHMLMIGAEGGWIDYEVNLFLQQGCDIAHLDKRILRTENAVSVCCAKAIFS